MTPQSKARPGTRKPQPASPDNNGATPRFYYDKEKRQYWRENPRGEFVITSETDLRRHCRMIGMDVDLPDSPEVFKLTKFEAALCRAQNDAAVDNVIALAGHRAGVFITQDGRKILVPRQPRLIVPKPGEWRNFEAMLAELLGGKQLPYGLAWLKVMLEDLRTLNPSAWRHHQLLALVGPPGCGKSFFQLLITLLAGGRSTDPYLWMVGKSDFNEHIAECEHLMMEDKQAHRDVKSRSAFAAKIKELTVSSDTAIHGKGKKQFSAPCFRRMSISANADSDYITVLPMLDESIVDKMLLLKCSKATMLPDFAQNRARFERELPAFAHFLLCDFVIPPNLCSDRFGVVHYHNPEVVELLQDFEPHLRFSELVNATFFADGKRETIMETPSEIHRQLIEGPHGSLARQLLCNSSACGQLLSRMAKEQAARFVRSKIKGERRWTIHPPAE